jgi:histidine triad (HIT) family protein
MTDCIFCKIANKEAPAKVEYEDDLCIAFHDAHPKAPVHVMVVPKKHIATVNDASEEDKLILGNLLLAAKKVAAKLGISERGYRLIVNFGPDAGMVINHLHLHVLGGKKMGPKGQEEM